MLKRILLGGFIIGCIDGAAACINVYIKLGMMPDRLFQYVATGILGRDAFTGGLAAALLGLLAHFFIATAATGVFFFLYTKISFLKKYDLLCGAAYGVLVWLTMSFIVVPLSAVPPSNPGTTAIITGILIHIFIIGMPISYLARRFHGKSSSLQIEMA